ncbi:hypothetical protein ACTFIR_008219 [Dictyostelium discoideum]
MKRLLEISCQKQNSIKSLSTPLSKYVNNNNNSNNYKAIFINLLQQQNQHHQQQQITFNSSNTKTFNINEFNFKRLFCTNKNIKNEIENEIENDKVEEEDEEEEELNVNNNNNNNNNNKNIEEINNSNKQQQQQQPYQRVLMKPISNKPVIAIIGKPNVGKSTIFNRIIEGQRRALVEEIPGTTRDRYYGEGFLYGREFILVDTGGLIGESKEDKDQFQGVIQDQAEIAMEEADAILFVLDYKSGLTSIDKELARMLRSKRQKLGKPIYIGVNKADNVSMRGEDFEEMKTQITRLGFGQPIPFSAHHGDNVHSMFELILSQFPHMDLSLEKLEEDLKPGPIRISIVGQPNAGKSSLLNKIIEEERSIVSDIPGTTHDPVDCNFLWRDTHELSLIDTAGIRRRSTHKIGLEKSSVLWALKAIEKSHVVFIVIDATIGITEQDLKIASFVVENRKSMIIIVNKWDLYLKNIHATQKITDKLFFHDFQNKSSSSSSKSIANENFDTSFTLDTLLDDLISHNIKNSKTDDVLNRNGKKKDSSKKKSSILEERKTRKQKIREEQEEEKQKQLQHSSDLEYSNIYWPDAKNDHVDDIDDIDDIDEIGGGDGEVYDFDIDEILKEERYQEDKEGEENHEDEEEGDSDEKFQKAYIEYLKNKELKLEELEKITSQNKIKRPSPPNVEMPKITKLQKDYETELRSKLSFLDFAPILFTSAKTGFCVPTAIDLSIKIFFEREKRLRVAELIEIIKLVSFKHKFPKMGRNTLKLKFAQQARGYPPTFVFWVNHPDNVEPSVVRFLLRSIRDYYPFVGTPIYVQFRKNKANKKKFYKKVSSSSSSSSSSNKGGYNKRRNNNSKH